MSRYGGSGIALKRPAIAGRTLSLRQLVWEAKVLKRRGPGDEALPAGVCL